MFTFASGPRSLCSLRTEVSGKLVLPWGPLGAALGLAAPAAAVNSDCCYPHCSAGCDEHSCQLAVCEADPFCCGSTWDGLCALAANEICSACDPLSDCCVANGNAGCDDDSCASAVCAGDAFCCQVKWDDVCVDEAATVCPGLCGPCDWDCPANLNGDCLVDGGDLGLLLSSWGQQSSCANLDRAGAVDGADLGLLLATWGQCPTCCPSSTHDCCTSGDPGCTDTACCKLVCQIDPPCCSAAWDKACVGEASDLCCLACSTACSAADHDCFSTGGPGCTDFKCCEAVCAIDSFCCDVSWDSICVGKAESICRIDRPGLCPENDHDCCTTGTPGCTNVKCCESVCEVDLFCCQTFWDGICVGEAVTICGLDCVDCPESDHDCYTTGIPGCTDLECCEAVCGADLFCCQTVWDGICVSEAFSICGWPKCPFECTGTDEGEPCPSDTNGGCNSVPPVFGVINCGDTICGTAWADGSFRDTDWYQIGLTQLPGTDVTYQIVTTLPMVIGIVDTDGVPDCALATTLNPFAVAPFCGTASFDASLPAGTYWFFAAPNGFSGFPCGGLNDYAITLTCVGESVPPACGNAGHDCLTTGGPFCDDAPCCETVCASDPPCCHDAWDVACVAEAFSMCGQGGADAPSRPPPAASGYCALAQGALDSALASILYHESLPFLGAGDPPTFPELEHAVRGLENTRSYFLGRATFYLIAASDDGAECVPGIDWNASIGNVAAASNQVSVAIHHIKAFPGAENSEDLQDLYLAALCALQRADCYIGEGICAGIPCNACLFGDPPPACGPPG